MKSKVLLVLAIALLVLLSVSMVSCGDEDYTTIETQGFVYEDGIYRITVSSDIQTYDLFSKVTILEDAECELSKNKDFSDTIGGKFELKPGDNYLYLRVTDDNDHEKVYTFNIYKKKVVNVTFNPGEGHMNNTSISVEEGTIITAPSADRVGYILSWDYDFSKPVTSDLTINANWTPIDCTITTVVDGERVNYPVIYGTVPSGITTPEKKGYYFDCWLLDNVRFDVSAPFQSDSNAIEIYAQFKPIVFNVQYVIDSNVVTNNIKNPANFNIEIINEQTSIELFSPTHQSKYYSFVGWYLDAELSNAISSISLDTLNIIDETETLTLYPKWRTHAKVEYIANEGICDKESDTFICGDQFTLPTPTRDNYVFDGWYDEDGTKIKNSGVWTTTGEVKLTASWSPRQNDIEYILNGDGAENNANNPSTFDIEDESIELLAPTYDSKHEFVGWYRDPGFAETSKITHITKDMVGENVTLYAKWTYVSTVTYIANGGTCETLTQDIVNGEDYTLTIPTREKYKFSGWYYKDTLVNSTGKWIYDSDIELVAAWVAEELKINYELFGGINNDGNKDRYTVETDPDSLMLLDPSKPYSTFDGWYLDADFENKIDRIDPATYNGETVYAKWITKQVVINYDPNGGIISNSQMTVNLGESFKLSIPTRSGYKFLGWFVGEKQITDNEPWTDETSLELNLLASWEIIEYFITYDLDNGHVNAILVEKYTVETEDFKLPYPTRENFYFIGWSLNGGPASASVVISKGSTGDRAYKAIWSSEKDESTGLIFSIVDGKAIVVGLERVIDDNIINGITIPSKYNGYDVVAIETNAFKDFGEKFVKTSYANMSSSYVTIYMPTSIKRIGANAYTTCNGIKVSLYGGNGGYVSEEFIRNWEKTATWESGNGSARDCIWGFRPAIGWTRYTQVVIPDDYE